MLQGADLDTKGEEKGGEGYLQWHILYDRWHLSSAKLFPDHGSGSKSISLSKATLVRRYTDPQVEIVSWGYMHFQAEYSLCVVFLYLQFRIKTKVEQARSPCMYRAWKPKHTILPGHRLHLHIWYWMTSSCVQSCSQSNERLSKPCPRTRQPGFGPNHPHSAAIWRLPELHDSGLGPGRPLPWFSQLTLQLLGVCHILGRRVEEMKKWENEAEK